MSRSTHLPTEGPFHLEATVRLLQRRPRDPVDRFEDGSYRRLWERDGGLVLTEVRNRGSLERPELLLDFPLGAPSPQVRDEIAGTLRKVLGLDVNLHAFERALDSHPALHTIARDLRGARPPRFPDLFEALGRTIPFQQLSLDAGVTLVSRLVAKYGRTESVGDELLHAFPLPASIASARPEEIRTLGFSGMKARAMVELAQAIAAGTLRGEEIEELPTEGAFRTLRSLRGIGPWTANLVLLRGFGRLDAFPAGDVGVTRGLARILGEDPKLFAAESFALGLGDQRGMLYFYSLGAQLLATGLVTPASHL
jgi:DNA-3-methyladenine glycosylase II